MKQALIVFAKPPIAGFAKTRLIPALGKEGAADYHKKLLHHTLKNVVSPDEWDTFLWCSENKSHPFFKKCTKEFDIKLREQVQGDLGKRMTDAVEEMLSEYKRVCIIGSDCPVLDHKKIKKVFSCLITEKDIAITPAEDGGYVLLAVNNKLEPTIFSNIQWGTSMVFLQTVCQIKLVKLNMIVQPTLWDVDEPADLSRIDL